MVLLSVGMGSAAAGLGLGKGVVVIQKIFSWVAIAGGVALALYGVLGIARYGFYLSGRWSLGQTEGGLAPLFLLIGLLAAAYGVFDLRLKAGGGDERARSAGSGGED